MNFLSPFKASLLLFAALLAIVAVPATAAGHRDSGFGDHGSLVFASAKNHAQGEEGFFEVVPDPRGGFVASNGEAIYMYGNDGKRDRSFGRDGRVAITLPPGREFIAAGIAVDARGRIVLAGTSTLTGVPPQLIAPRESRVARYLPNGIPDPSFGEGGAVEGTLGLPEPVYEVTPDPSRPLPAYQPPIASTSVDALALDASGRPLVGGSYAERFEDCYPYLGYSPIHNAYVRRLSINGAVEPGFVPPVGDDASTTSLVSRKRGDALFGTVGGDECVRAPAEVAAAPFLTLGDIASDGSLEPSFHAGALTFPPVVDGRERILYGGTEPNRGIAAKTVTRLTPKGAPDKTFGRGGTVVFPAPKGSSLALVAVDGEKRLLLAGSIQSNQSRRSTSLVVGLSAAGRIDRHFGRNGYAHLAFGSTANSRATGVLPRGNALLVTDKVVPAGKPNAARFVVVKYLPGR